MASLLAKPKASEKVEDLQVEDPACVGPPVGGNSCEELRAQMDALDGTRQRLKQQARQGCKFAPCSYEQFGLLF